MLDISIIHIRKFSKINYQYYYFLCQKFLFKETDKLI